MDISSKWVAHLRRKHLLEGQDEQANHPRSHDGERQYTSTFSKKPSCFARSEAETMPPSSRRPPPPRSEDTEDEDRPSSFRSWTRQKLDVDMDKWPKSSARWLWTEGDGPRAARPTPARPTRPRPPLATSTQSSSNDDNDSSHDTPKMMLQPETRPISHDQLVAEVKGIYASLVMVETKCIEVDNAQSSTTGDARLNNKQWQALINEHRKLLEEPRRFFSIPPQLFPSTTIQRLESKYSLHSRAWRRLNDRLLPLLRREQDVESSRQWLEVTKLSSSLIDLLRRNESTFDHPELDLQEVLDQLQEELDQIEAILARLQLRFRRKYDELSRKNGPTEPVFEFPDNIRYICTTMPWTISPVLVVLWGVCWMFINSIIGRRDAEHEKSTVPMLPIPPLLLACGVQDDFFGPSTEAGYECSVVPEFDGTVYTSQPTIETSGNGEAWMIGGAFDTLYSFQATPQDPNFLTQGVAMSGELDNLELAEEDHRILAETLPAAMTLNPAPHPFHRTEQQDSTAPTIDAVLTANEEQESSSVSSGQQSRPRIECADCKKTFARSFTLTRHRAETHSKTTQASEKVYPCPNTSCKKNKEEFAFKRRSHLERHLKTCKDNQDTSSSQEERDSVLPMPTLASPGELHHPAALQAEAANPNSGKKRTRSDDGSGESNDDQLLRALMEQRQAIAEEVEVKKRKYLQALSDLKTVEATIQVFQKRGTKRMRS